MDTQLKWAAGKYIYILHDLSENYFYNEMRLNSIAYISI